MQNNSLVHMQTVYEQPWDRLKTSFINNLSSANNHHERLIQPMPNIEQTKQRSSPPARSLSATCQHSEEIRKIPIDNYSYVLISSLLRFFSPDGKS